MGRDILIRDAVHTDYKSLCNMFAEANKEHRAARPDLYRRVDVPIPPLKFHLALLAKSLFGYQPVSLQVAVCEGKNVGAVFVQSLSRSRLSWSAFEKEAYIDNIVVAPAYRRQGIGSALLNAAQEWAKATGHSHAWGKVINSNHASIGMVRKAGFEADSTNFGRHL